MNRLLTYLILLIVASAAVGCDTDSDKAILLNNKATEVRMKFDEFSNDSALIIYDKAIELDNSYYLPHSNKASIYIEEKSYKKALIEMELCLLKKTDLAEAWFFTGMLYDKFKFSNKAKKYYSKSIELFNLRIKNDDYDNEFFKDGDIINRAMSLKFIGDTNYMDGISEIREKKGQSQNTILYEIEEKSKVELMKDMGLYKKDSCLITPTRKASYPH